MAGMGLADRRQAEPVPAKVPRQGLTADAVELRQAIAAVLQHADAWHDADPDRRFTPTLHAPARASPGPHHVELAQVAHALLPILACQPSTHSPARAATAR